MSERASEREGGRERLLQSRVVEVGWLQRPPLGGIGNDSVVYILPKYATNLDLGEGQGGGDRPQVVDKVLRAATMLVKQHDQGCHHHHDDE